MSERSIVSRRRFCALSATAVGALAVTACGGGDALPGQTPTNPTPAAQATTATTQPTAAATRPPAVAQPTAAVRPPTTGGQQAPATTRPTSYTEAPQLAQLVREGKLPPVEGRLPQAPLVVQPVEQAGKYGGTWRMGLVGGADTALLIRTIGYDYLVRWDPEWEQVLPNVAESFTASPDAKEYTFKLREGLKWSDGQPYTADDIVFYVEDITKNKDLTSNRGDNPPEVRKIDEYTVTIAFAKANGLFLQNQATPAGDAWTRYPAHYLKQFHAKYNTTNLDQLVKEAGAKDWVELFRLKGAGISGTSYDARWQNPDLPTLLAWKITSPYGGNVTRVVAERNPYYFKVDPAGNQLPYIDRVIYEVTQDAQVLVLKAANGEIDMQSRNLASNQNKAVFTDNQGRGGYRFYETIPANMNTLVIGLNQTHKDPVKRQVFQNRDFRIGLSHAVNRQEIIDVVYVGQGEPWQAAPRKESGFFNERLAKQYTEYDPKQATEYLDRAFPQKDGNGIRLGPDGKPIAFQVEAATAQADQIDALNLIQGYWRKVGVDMQVKAEDRSLFITRKNANEADALAWGGDGGLRDALLAPLYYLPFDTDSLFAAAWATWFRPRADAKTAPEEPTSAAAKQQMDLYRQLEATGDPAKQTELLRQILAIAAEQFWVMGISLPANGYGIAKNTLKNVPKSMPSAWLYPDPGPTNTMQYFFAS
jgi:peptide/nickel transport system substrate-binding protein